MRTLVRLLLIYASALCLILSAFGLAPIVAVAGSGASGSVVPWLLVVGGVLGALDCWRLSRRLSNRMAARTRDRWTGGRVELFARPSQDFWMTLASVTLVGIVLFALLVGVPNTRDRRLDRSYPYARVDSTTQADGQHQVAIGDSALETLRRYFAIPRKRTLDGWGAALMLLAFGFPALLVWTVQGPFRRDGRASLVLDEHGIDHVWTGHIPWRRVHGMALGGTHRQASPFLYLLVADPVPLRKRLPWRVSFFELRPIPPDEPFGEILLSLYPLECDEHRLLNAARHLHAAAPTAPALNRDWRPGIDIEYVRGLELTVPPPGPALSVGGPSRPTGRPPAAAIGLTWGDRLSILWVTSLSLISAAHLLAVLLLGAEPWMPTTPTGMP